MFSSPWSIFFESVASLVCLDLIANLNLSFTLLRGSTLLEQHTVVIGDNRSEKIVPVQALP
jgi:hypothetical protein